MKKDYIKQNILSKFPGIASTLIKEQDDEGNQFDFNFLAESMEGMFDSFGKHAGGIISIGNKADINLISPLCYPGNDPSAQLCVMHEYHMIENQLY